jgi:hypothetical protein
MRRSDAITLALCALIAGCHRDAAIPDSATISASLSAAASSARDSVIVIRHAVPGSWREVYVFAPYSSDAFIARCLGAPIDARDDQGISHRDDIHLLVFRLPDSSLVRRAIARKPDFDPESFSRVYDTRAAFKLRPSSDGSWLTLVPVAGLIRRCK